MKKRMVCLALATAVLSTALASCSVGGGADTTETTQQSVMSYSEKASFYDALVAGDSDPIPLTTLMNNMVSIEGDANLLEEDIYERIVEVANRTFPSIRSRYGYMYLNSVLVILDASAASYTPCSAVGTTVLLNTDWLNNHPGECDVLIDGFASIVLNYGKTDQAPGWLIDAMKAYIRDEYAIYRSESSFQLPKKYDSKSYEKSKETAAAFLKWIKQTLHVDIMLALNRQLRTPQGYQPSVWSDATGKTLEQLWYEYTHA